jgi:ligand-binding sensor domain-containing protein
LLLLTLITRPAKAQSTLNLKFDHYGTFNGLGSINARKTTLDSRGFIWTATQDGLYRFAGNQFIAYGKGYPKPHDLTGSDIRDLLVCGDTLWAVNSYGGIDAINIITGEVIFQWDQSQNPEFKDALFLSMAIKGDSLLIGSDKGLFCLDIRKQRLSVIKFAEGNLNVNKILADSNGLLWVFCLNKGVFILDCKSLQTKSYYNETAVFYFDCTATSANTAMAGTNKGIRSYHFAKNTITVNTNPFPQIPVSQNTNIFAIKRDRNQNIWFSNKSNLVKISGNQFEYVSQSKLFDQQDWTKSVFGIFFDNKNNLWLSCQQGLAFAANEEAEIVAIGKSRDSEVFINHSYYLLPYNDSITYACAEDGLYLINQKTGSVKGLDRNKSYFYLFTDHRNNLIVSNDEGTFIFKNNKLFNLATIYREFEKMGTIMLNSHIPLGDSVYILGSQNKRGIFYWNYKKNTVLNINAESDKISLQDNIVNTVYKDASGTIWVLCDNSLALYNVGNNEMRFLNLVNPVTKKSYNIFFDIRQVGERYYLTSYNDGIVVLDKNYKFIQEISRNNGLSNNGVYKLLPYKDSLLLATTNNGLSVINLSDYSIKNYFERDGLHSDVFEELSGNVSGGLVYAGGPKGYSVINPARLKSNPDPPSVYIFNIHEETGTGTYDVSNLELNRIEIPSNILQTTITFSALNYSNSAGTTFSYRIKENNETWSNQSTRNFVNLLGLSPGTYTLEVKAANEDGVWSEPIQLTLIFLPKWYQTWWFKVLIALIAAVIAYGFYRMRIIQLKKEERIRKRIAGDLHDDLGSTLNSIKVYTNLALMKPGNAGYLEQLKVGVQNAIIGVRDLVWVLDDKQDTIRNLVERTEQFIGPLASANEIQFEKVVDVSVQDTVLGKEEKRNLYLIIKESVNNSIKYANPSTISLKIGYNERNKFRIVIADNGKGFDLSSIKKGNGLENISLRAGQIGYDLNIDSTAGNGTSIILTKT